MIKKILSKKVITQQLWAAFLTSSFVVSAMAYVLAQSSLFYPTSVQSGEGAAKNLTNHSYFASERLEAFSGYGFNLKPALISFLDQLEASIDHRQIQQTPVEQLAKEYFRFVNQEQVQFEIYKIKRGDNFWKIAKKRGYTIDTIVGNNPHLEDIVCYVNQRIILPSRGGSLHQVTNDETINTIALDYGVKGHDIKTANQLHPKWGLIPGMWLFIPGAKPRKLSEKMHDQYAKRALFRSPLAGRYTSFVGKRVHPVTGFSKFHNGVDIACPMNTWVGASASGLVIRAGWGGAIGKYIKIDHENGYQTVYGHLNKIYVKKGQRVKKGRLIGRSGKTGRVTGPHLHFTIYENGRVVNPMDYLW